MTTLLVGHAAFLAHAAPAHPERPDRLRALERALAGDAFAALKRMEAPLAGDEAILRVHASAHVARVRGAEPEAGITHLDADTYVSPGSIEAASRAAGAAIAAVDAVFDGTAGNAFCAVRPPGHHAETRRAMGFCLFNSAAVAARHAQAVRGAAKVAVVDFDVHHGNGTQEVFWSDPSVLYASTHQMPLYPGTGAREETGAGNIVNAPLRPGDGGPAFRAAMETTVLPAVDRFAPDLVIVSAGFDAHARDPLGQLNLLEADFAWATRQLLELAATHAEGRLVSLLEGGYDLTGLAGSAAAHVEALMGA
jgi:acetoin utilization deacetylase AcuC-like enzyme